MLSVDDTAAGPHAPGAGLDHERIVLQARDVGFDWSELPVHYVPGEPFVTHFCDVLHLLLPAGEEFFVEVFKQALPLIKDDQLRLDVQGFIGQEATHSQAHAAVVDHLAARGVDMAPFTAQMAWLFGKLLGDRPHWGERRQQRWLLERVALVAAVEHYTAILGEWILDSPALDAIGVHPVMLDMLRWHGAEEVEHKAVAFDVMKHLRAGFLRQVRTQLAVTPLMLMMWVRGLRYMYKADPLLPPGTRPRWRDWFVAARRGLVPSPWEFLPAIASYYRPGFHPAQLGGVEKAVNYLAVSPAARATH
ncbi:metal-dependent hydrolase [Mycolicibacter hiberniae]|nr:metal-dependent hydrolase [Mycolicibacter hiberniae]MCV7084624.1 metal-dependent hydrolase [Mycolicibacter hiberniae]ORV71703.1 metal-dependent hydrolase [Mycolicibacter hiberniae]